MNRDDVLRMAIEAGMSPPQEAHEFWICDPSDLERFFSQAYAAGAAAEREECAKVCDALAALSVPDLAAVAIRARGES